MTAQKCPVCDGDGLVPARRYDPVQQPADVADERPRVSCRGCGGTGVVPLQPPYPLTPAPWGWPPPGTPPWQPLTPWYEGPSVWPPQTWCGGW